MKSNKFKINNLYILFILFILFIQSIYAEPKQWDVNKHFYDVIILTPRDWASAKSYISNYKPPGTSIPSNYVAYIGTINTAEELAFVNTVPRGSDFYVGMVRGSYFNAWAFDAGPGTSESGSLVYDTVTLKCSHYCLFGLGEPSNEQRNNIVYSATNKNFYAKFFDTTVNNQYLVEWAPPNEPYVPPVTTAGGQVSVTLTGFDISKTNITYTPAGKTPIRLPIQSSSGQVVTFNIPSGGNINNITFSDSVNTYSNTIYKYQTPAIEMVYPTTLINTQITITGTSFGSVSSDISVKLGFNGILCTSPQILINNTAFACTLPFAPSSTNTIYPILIQIGSSNPFYSVNFPIYDKENLRAIGFNPSQSSVWQNGQFILSTKNFIQGYSNYAGVPSSVNQISLVKYIVPFSNAAVGFDYHVGVVGAGGVAIFNQTGGPYDGIVAVNQNSACQTQYLIACPMGYNGGMAALKNTYFQYRDNIYGINLDKDDGFHGCVLMYGVNPSISSNDPANTGNKFFNTTGGFHNISLSAGIGFTYTKRSWTLNGVSMTSTLTPFFDTQKIQITIPEGTGGPKQSAVSFENLSVNGPLIGYYSPWIISSSNPSTTGGAFTVSGVNFGNKINLISVTLDSGSINCPVSQLSVPHTEIICTIPSGVGTHSIQVRVDSQLQTNFFSMLYAAPNITNIVQVGTSLNIYGTNFGNIASQITVQLPDPISVTYNGLQDSNYSISIPQLPLLVKNGLISISVAGQQSNGFKWEYIPIISSIYPLAVSSQGEDLITITGKFLGGFRQDNSPVNSTILLGGKECTSPYFFSNISDTFIQCKSPKGTGKNLNIEVTIDGKKSNTLNSFSYIPPFIRNVHQIGTSATITGDNFGEDYKLIYVTYNGVNTVQASTMFVDKNQVVANIPYDTTNGFISVTVNGQLSNQFNFNIAPIITSISNIPTSGGLISIGGYYFNPKDYLNNTLDLLVTFNGKPCDDPKITTPNTQMTCIAVPGTGINKVLEVSIFGLIDDEIVNYMPPQIVTVSNNDTSFSISGSQFGTNSSLIEVVYATIDNLRLKVTADSVSTSGSVQTVVSNNIPDSAINGPLYIIVDHQSSNELPYSLIPIISSVSIPPTIGGNVVIEGSHLTSIRFDGNSTNVGVSVRGQPCTNPQVITFSSLNCTVEAGTGISNNMIVSIDGKPSNQIQLAYQPPTITSFYQEDQTIVVQGLNIGQNLANSIVSFGGRVGPATKATQVELQGPIPLFSMNGNFSIQVDGQRSNIKDIQLKPIIASISSTGTTGGEITIKGYFINFYRQNGTQTDFSINFLFGSGNVACDNPQPITTDLVYTSLVCTAPPGTGFSIPVEITIDGLSSSIDFSYGAPTLTSVLVSKVNLISLQGTNFGSVSSDVIVTLSGHPVQNFTLIDDTHIQFTAPLDAVNGLVTVSVSSRTSNGGQVSLYPILSTVTGSDTQGSVITLSGKYLNHFSYGGYINNVEILIDNVNCTDIQWTNGSQELTCLSPAGTGVSHQLSISIEDLPGNSLPFKYNPPSIGSTIQEDDIMTIIGTNFGDAQPKVTISNGYSIVSVNHSQVVVNIPSGALNNLFTITVDTQTSNTFLLDLTPIITSTTSASPYGGVVTINGRYLNTKDSSGNNNQINITIGEQVCTFIDAPQNGKVFTCTIGKSSFKNEQVNLTIESKTGLGQYTSISPSITQSSQLFYMVGGNVTITGQEFIEPISVSIANTSCSSPQLLSPSSIICYYTATDDILNTANITIGSGLLSGSQSIFSYYVEECEKNCSNNGQCFSGYCSCNAGYSGSLCDIKYNREILPTFSSYISVFTGENITFTVELAGIREVNSNSQTVKFLGSDTLNWTLDNSIENAQKKVNIYLASQGNISLSITATNWFQNSVVLFVGQNLPNPVNSIKQSIQINSWSFENQENSLEIVYRIYYTSGLIFDCKNMTATPTQYYNPLTNTMRSFTLDTPFGVLVGSFSNRVSRDQVGNLIDIQTVNKSSSEIPSLDGLISQLVSISVPSFETSILLDPTFVAYSKILSIQSSCSNSPKKSKKDWLIPVIVVASVVGAVAIGTAGFLIYRNRKQNIEMKKKMVQMDFK